MARLSWTQPGKIRFVDAQGAKGFGHDGCVPGGGDNEMLRLTLFVDTGRLKFVVQVLRRSRSGSQAVQ